MKLALKNDDGSLGVPLQARARSTQDAAISGYHMPLEIYRVLHPHPRLLTAWQTSFRCYLIVMSY